MDKVSSTLFPNSVQSKRERILEKVVNFLQKVQRITIPHLALVAEISPLGLKWKTRIRLTAIDVYPATKVKARIRLSCLTEAKKMIIATKPAAPVIQSHLTGRIAQGL